MIAYYSLNMFLIKSKTRQLLPLYTV